jgi:5-methylcytosine-specific restriction endonuclease McrA
MGYDANLMRSGLEPLAVKPRNSLNASHLIQVQVFRRDRWRCRWCGCPVIFAPVMRYLADWVKGEGCDTMLPYYHRNWRRRDAPLLDRLGPVIDHVEAHSGGGASVISNLATACNKCNGRKSNAHAEDFSKRNPLIPVKRKYGDPLARLGWLVHSFHDFDSAASRSCGSHRARMVACVES